MTQIAGTTDVYRIGTAGGVREDLEDVIWDLFAEESWALTNLSHISAEQPYHEWLTDVLTAATANRQIEGDDAAFTTQAAPTRLGNYCQISRKTFLISGTLEVSSKAGRTSELARMAMRNMRELKNEMEYALLRNQASSAGGSATARSSAGMESWMSTNEILATTTSSATTPGFSSGTVAAPTDGSTTGAFTEGSLKSALTASWSAGGMVSTILVGSSQKAAIDTFPGQATRFVNVERTSQASIVGAANVYVSSVGTHTVIMHRHIRATVALCIDPEYWAIAFLRNPFVETLAKTGDGEKRQMLAEYCLVSRNEAASAKVVACA